MRIALLAVALIIDAAAHAQAPLTESVEVRVANVDVVVTDWDGKRITGLTSDDFELYENGVKQAITNFSEVRGNATVEITDARNRDASVEPAPPRARRILIFIDNYSLNTPRRAKVLDALERFLDRQKEPSDQVGIVVWNRSLRIVTPFTDDVGKLREGIKALRASVRGGISFTDEMERVRGECQRYWDRAERNDFMTFPEAFQLCQVAINAYSEEAFMTGRFLLDGLRATTARFAGLDGKKVLLFAGAHLPQAPGEELYFWMVRIFRQRLPQVNTTFSDSPRTPMRLALNDVAREATANDVALYFIDGGEVGDHTRSVEQGGMIDTSGLEAFLAVNNTADAFRNLARLTGGIVVGRTTDFDLAFTTVARDLSSYYSLGFRPSDAKGEKRIVVKMKNSSYSPRARASYTPKSFESELGERIVANLFHGGVKGEWTINVTTGTPVADGKHFRVPMEITFDPAVTLVPAGEELSGGYAVYVLMGNASGAVSKLLRSAQAIRILPSAEKELRTRPLTYSGTVVVRPGENTLSIAVVDQVTHAAGYATAKVVTQ